MKELLSALILLALVGSTAWANAPDPDACSVSPMDDMTNARVIGVLDQPSPSPFADLTIYVRNVDGLPISGAFVQVLLEEGAGCVTPGNESVICYCENVILTGYTDAAGLLELNGGFGGCCLDVGAVEIIADGVPIRGGNVGFVSPDWNNEKGDCAMGLADFLVFGQGYGVDSDECTDYTGDTHTDVGDFVIFGGAYFQGCTEGD